MKEIYEHQSQKINWYVADNGWTKGDKNEIRRVAKKSGNMVDLKVRFFKSKSELILRLNQKTYEKQKITNFTVYSHGFVGYLDFGYNGKNGHDVRFKLYRSDIGYIKKQSFSKPVSTFYSCQTAATDENGKSFAKQWQKRIGGITNAYACKTDYSNINHKYNLRITNFIYYAFGRHSKASITPSLNYPTGTLPVSYGK